MENEKIEKNKELFTQLLMGTGRNGIEKVLEGLENLGFFKAPASSRFTLPRTR